MSIDRLRYELQLLGKKVILPPILLVIGYILMAILLHYLKTNPSRFLESGPEMIMPMIVGMFAGNVITYDPALELQLTMPRKYQWTGLLRLLLIIVWTACIACLFLNTSAGLNLEYMFLPIHPGEALPRLIMRQLVWLAPLLWCVGLAFCFGLLMKSRAAGAALLGGIWIAEIIFKDYIAANSWLRPVMLFPTTLVLPATVIPQGWYDMWLSSRYEVIGTGLILIFVGWLFLRNPEGMLRSISED
ncbi:MAG TPA: hypothetical protein VHZ51_08320 [Ktedonobacteraceae bacterium]|nr:hypothetical protein [Ktedonobacteraceae bacterium]